MMFVEANQVDKLLNMTQRSCKHLFRCAALLGAMPESLTSMLQVANLTFVSIKQRKILKKFTWFNFCKSPTAVKLLCVILSNLSTWFASTNIILGASVNGSVRLTVVLFLSVKCNLFSVYLAWFGLVVVIKVRTVPRAQKDTLPTKAELFIKKTT